MKSYILIVLLFINLFSAAAEDSVVFNRLSLRDGLSNNSVNCILQDHLGFIWFGTFSGLNRYDGRNVEIFRPEPMNPSSISSSVIFDILEDSKQRLWIGTDGGGLNLYDYSDGSFRSYITDSRKDNGIRSQKVFCLEEDSSGRIWIGTADSGVSILTTETDIFTSLTTENSKGLFSNIIRTMMRDSAGRMWLGTQGGGLSLYQGDNTFNNFFPGNTVRAILEDSSHNMLIGLEGEGLIFMDGSSEELKFKTLIPDKTIRSIEEDELGRIWVGTERNGLYLIEKDKSIRNIVHDQDDSLSLSSDFIRDIMVDQSGLVWIASRGGGVNSFNSRSEDFSYLIKGSYAVRQINESPDGSLWVATDGQGLIRINPNNTMTHFFSEDKSLSDLASNHIYALTDDNHGNLWIGSDGDGLDRLNIKTGEITHYKSDPQNPNSLSSDVIWSLLYDMEGNLWIGTEGGGLNLYNPGTDGFITFKNDPDRTDSLLGNSIKALFQDASGELWVGTWDGGLSRKISGKDEFINYTRDPKDPNSLSDNSVLCFAQTNDGSLWIGTAGGGLNKFDPNTQQFQSYRERDGLSDDNIFGIIPDGKGFLWISTANGMSRFDIITHESNNFWSTGGLVTNEFGQNAYLKRESGELLFGTTKGVLSFFPNNVHLNSYAPPVRITDFSLNNESVKVLTENRGHVNLEKNILISSEVNIYPGDNFIGFSFASLDFSNPLNNQYAIKLAGFDKDWHYLGSENTYYYSSLPPGTYSLDVLGTNSNGAWSTEYSELTLNVIPSFYQTGYFYGLVFIVLSCLFYLGVRVRLSGLNKHNKLLQEFSIYVQDIREEERKSIARDVHDELGQLLTTLKMHIFWLSNNASSIKVQRQARYDSMLGIINTTLDWSKELATKLRPVILDNLSLGEALNWLINETEKNSNLIISHSIHDTPEIPVERATSIFRIIQEAITNILRHTKATEANLSLIIHNGFLIIKLKDNGKGIPKNKLTDSVSYGIIGMRERSRHLGGELTIDSSPLGTSINLKIPI